MRRLTQIAVGLVCVALAGCRATAKVTEVPRVDLLLEGGNRGYLVGKAPEATGLKTTRQMVEATVEVPTLYHARRLGAPVSLEGIAPPERELDEGEGRVATAPERYDTYVVQQGDSLWSIAAKPEVYGKATQWRRIFDANRDLLNSPDQLKAGMTLKIPRGDGGDDEDDDITFKK